MENNPFFAFGAKLGEFVFEYDLIKLVQAYMVGDPKYGYTAEGAQRTYQPFFRRLKKATNATLMISPEGHRSPDGKLQKGEEGIELMTRLLYPVICLPIGIRYEGDDFERSELNIGKKVDLTVAQPIYKEDASTKVTLDDLMIRLASILPPHMRGVWEREL